MSRCTKVNLTDTDLFYANKLKGDKQLWAWWLNHIGTLFVFIIGLCGNILCLVVLCRRRLRRNSYTQYLIALAIVDTGAIFAEVLSALDELYRYEYKSILIAHTRLSCKVYNYIRYMFYSMSSWIIVVLALERLVAIKFPLWSKHICNVVNARRILLAILLFTMFIHSYHLIIKDLDCSPSPFSTKGCRCKTKPDKIYLTVDLILTVYVWRITLMTLLPSIIIITANILIMNKLFHESSLADYINADGNARRKMKIVYKISRMLVIVTWIFLLLHVPGSCFDIMKHMYLFVFATCNPKLRYYLQLSHQICDLLTNMSYGINFYLYIISGKHIRTELVHICRNSSLHSKSSMRHCKYNRSSYFASSCMAPARNNQPRDANMPLSVQRTDSCH